MLENLDGFLLVDKPAGIAFSSVIKAVKRKFNLVKVGHGGSLDAMASGLFILLINDANKFVGEVMGADRAYEGVMRLGSKTNTGDIHGESVGGDGAAVAGALADAEKLQSVVKSFKGDIFQSEPRFCSVRKEGSAAYEIADTGEHSQFLSHVYRLRTAPIDGGKLRFEMTCTKSLIVRALVDDFGDALGCGACVESLRRTKIGKFEVADAVPFDKLLETEIKDFASLTLPLSVALR